MKKYQGVFPAFYACYDENGNICTETVEKYTKWLIEKGVDGIYVCGSSGECIYQSMAERKLILEHAVKAAEGKLTIIAHVACNNTKDSMELAAHAEKLGVDAIAAIPPIYFKLPPHAIAKYWNDISSAAPNTDFIIYNIPQLAGVELTVPLLNTMLENPKVIGVKNSSMPTYDIQKFKDAAQRKGRDFVVYNGPDEQFISGRIIGADGGIGGTYSAMPELFVKLNRLLLDKDWQAAQALQNDINGIISVLVSGKCNMYALIKAVLKKRTGIDMHGVREPLFQLTQEDLPLVEQACELIEAAIKKYGA
ncbi:MAG: dihydrodipicolinate synthase family protein [Oscillospiraceae bacterium]|nr:dihydrodipicolinate synthase family protein [Oscillospiraceae bacterium]